MSGWARGLFRQTAARLLPSREAYALWADTYPPRPHNPLMEIEQAIVAPIIGSIAPLRALDVGTGSGRYLPLLASTGARLVVGVDFSLPMLRRQTEGVPRVCGDACLLPFRNASFDLVSSSLMVGDVADLAGWIDELARVLAPGGHLIYSDVHPSWATERWRRTFRTADGRSFEVAYFPHPIAEHLALLDGRAFEIRAIREPRPAAPDGAAWLRRSSPRNAPLVVVFHAVKNGSSYTSGERRRRAAARA